jgi:hypothetical protein
MANAFTATRAWRSGGPVGKTFLHQLGTLVVDTTASGGAADGDLPATMFGLTEIISVGHIVNDDNSKVYFGGPSYDGDSLMVNGGASNAPSDLANDTYKMTVVGLS